MTGADRPPPAWPLVLASTSPFRRALLERLGVPFSVRAPLVDEEGLKDVALPPRQLAERLATAKAQSIAADAPNAVVVGSDQIVTLDGRLFGKPGNAPSAIEQLLALAGRCHEVITAVAVCHRDRQIVHTDVTRLWMRPLDRSEVERYVVADQPLECAGSYKLEVRGITLFDRIDSADHTAVTGLPLMALTSILRDLGFAVP